MAEVTDQYVIAEILLHQEDMMAKGQVVALQFDVSWNVLGRAHANPILDTSCNKWSSGGKVSEWTVNGIAESMYAQCDADGNDCSLLDFFFDYPKDSKAIFPFRPTEQCTGQANNP